MANESANVQMRLLSVSEVSFQMYPDAIEQGTPSEDVKIGFSNSIEVQSGQDTIAILFGVRYLGGEKIVLESIYRFSFEVHNLGDFITVNKDDTITVRHLMPHFLSVAVGTMRGILVAKTAGTPLASYPIPMVDPNQLNKQLSVKR